MQVLYAPWRDQYTKDAEQEGKKSDVCIFCQFLIDTGNDEKNGLLKRFKHCYVLLNFYPYNGGHLLVVPNRHTSALSQLSHYERSELFDVTNKSIILLEKEYQPQGFNIGMNLGGKAAGGSIPEHVHMHVLPRWLGDTAFLVPLADTKPVSQDLNAIYKKLKTAIAAGAL